MIIKISWKQNVMLNYIFNLKFMMDTLMNPEVVLISEAMEILVKKLGLVDAERFIDFIKRDKFD